MSSSDLQAKSPTSTLLAVALTFIVSLTTLSGPVHGEAPQLLGIPPSSIIIDLDSYGVLHINQERVDLSGLVGRLLDLSATRTDAAVVIVAAPTVAFKELVTTVDTVRAAGIERVGILKSKQGGSASLSQPPLGATVLSVDRAGVVRLDGKKMKLREVGSQLRKLFTRRNDRTVYVQAYGALSFDTVGSVIEAAKAAGAMPIGLIASSQ